MKKLSEIYDYINSIAPADTQMDFDNAGFLFGDRNSSVSKVLLALDCTSAVIDEAIEKKAEAIITHHPLIFKPVKNICTDTLTGNKLIKLAKNDISVISMHTNLDLADGGVNDVLIRLLGAVTVYKPASEPMLRIGFLKEAIELDSFLLSIKQVLSANGLRYCSGGRKVYKIACLGGAGGEAFADAYNEGCDTYITSDIKYNVFLDARELGINLIDADHFCTENPVIYDLKRRLVCEFSSVEFIISEKHCQTAQFV